ncbi:MAG: histidine phosphatase family protein [Phycisphaerae bacterium]
MRKLILIKHARPVVEAGVPSDQWRLGQDGRSSCGPVAERLRTLAPAAIYTSTEPKAKETAELIGSAIRVPVREADDLHEHDRSNEPHMDTREFISLMAVLFKEPSRRVLGLETGDDAYARFASAIDRILEADRNDVAVVTHGTVIALFAQRRLRKDGFAVWRAMGQPSTLVIDADKWVEVG